MKLITLLLVACSFSTFANNLQEPTQLILSGDATISVEQTATVTCMAIGCPPSTPYYTVSAVMRDSGFEVELLSKPGYAPEAIELFDDLAIENGAQVYVEVEARHRFLDYYYSLELVDLHLQ